MVGAVLLGVALATVSADGAQAFSVPCPGSSLCSPEGLAVLGELAAANGPAAVGAAGIAGASGGLTAVATGGVAGLGAFNTAIGVTGAATLLGTGAAVTVGLLASTGVPPGVHLTTVPVAGGTTASACDGTLCVSYLGLVSWSGANAQCWTASSSPASTAGTVTFQYTGWSATSFSFAGGAANFAAYSGWSTPCAALGGNMVANWSVVPDTYNLNGGASDSVPAAGWHGSVRVTLHCAGPVDPDIQTTATAPVDLPAGADIPVPSILCAPGFLATGTLVEFAPTTDPTGWLPLTNTTVPGAVRGMVTTYPDCFGPGVSPCALQLARSNPPGFVGCGRLAVLCPNWVAESDATPSAFRCTYGTYVLALDACSAFRSPGQLLPNTDGAGAAVSRDAPVGAVAIRTIVDPVTASPVTTPPVVDEPPIQCALGGGDNFFTSIVPFFQSLPGWVMCMIVPQGWDRGGVLAAAVTGGPLAASENAFITSLPTSISCGPVGTFPGLDGQTVTLNTCVMDVLPEPMKNVIGYAMVLPIAWLGTKRVLWALGGDSAPVGTIGGKP